MNNDLISRSALLNSYDVCNVTEYDESGCGMKYKAVSVEAIEKAPAVEAEPVRHGRWTFFKSIAGDEYTFKCSICNEWANQRYDYCPNCGAKMRGDNSVQE